MFLLFLLLASPVFAGTPLQISCDALHKAVGSHWSVDASVQGTLERQNKKIATLSQASSYFRVLYQGNEDEPFCEAWTIRRTFHSDEYYKPVKYKDHYRFEMKYRKTGTYEEGLIDFIFPTKLERYTKAYLVLTGINGEFGGTVPLRCRLSRMPKRIYKGAIDESLFSR